MFTDEYKHCHKSFSYCFIWNLTECRQRITEEKWQAGWDRAAKRRVESVFCQNIWEICLELVAMSQWAQIKQKHKWVVVKLCWLCNIAATELIKVQSQAFCAGKATWAQYLRATGEHNTLCETLQSGEYAVWSMCLHNAQRHSGKPSSSITERNWF